MKAFTKISPPRRPSPDLDDLLADEVTIAVMRADNVTPAEIRQLLNRVDHAMHVPPQSPQPCRFVRH